MLIVPPLANSPGVNSSESKSISDIGHGLELAVGINVLVSTADSDVAVADLVLDRVQVGIAVVEVTQLVSSLELQREMNNIYINTPTFIHLHLYTYIYTPTFIHIHLYTYIYIHKLEVIVIFCAAGATIEYRKWQNILVEKMDTENSWQLDHIVGMLIQ